MQKKTFVAVLLSLSLAITAYANAQTYPAANAIHIVGTDVMTLNIAKPTISISDLQTIQTVLVPSTQNGGLLDVSLVDDFIERVSANARHYPPVFANRTARYNAIEQLKQLTAWIDEYAKDKQASYEVLLRATKLNSMGRNLDLGSEYAMRANDYVARAIKLQDTAEANFLYGMMLSEGGGFREGEKYLTKAAKMGYVEAEQSLAQAELLNDQKPQALQRLMQLKAKHPNLPQIDQQINIIQNGKYYIWELPLNH